MERLGKAPLAPMSLSGSRKPHRYHLFFQHPDLPTKSKQTPWNERLEFRGHGGIVVIPSSLHKSGHCYEWAKGRSPDDIALPEIPAPIYKALKPLPRPKPVPISSSHKKLVAGIDASPQTKDFLAGKYSEGPHWNDRLFRAACDLCGRGMPFEKAEPLLLKGAQPWNLGEQEAARQTIVSAFSEPREPGYL